MVLILLLHKKKDLPSVTQTAHRVICSSVCNPSIPIGLCVADIKNPWKLGGQICWCKMAKINRACFKQGEN